MKIAYHEFYRDFKCIANKCPDSCCKEWDVVVDDDSYLKYKNAEATGFLPLTIAVVHFGIRICCAIFI